MAVVTDTPSTVPTQVTNTEVKNALKIVCRSFHRNW